MDEVFTLLGIDSSKKSKTERILGHLIPDREKAIKLYRACIDAGDSKEEARRNSGLALLDKLTDRMGEAQ